MQVENNKDCFVELWRKLELTRDALREQHKRFTIRRVLQTWVPARATDDFIREVCWLSEQWGLNELPPPHYTPKKNREFLTAFVAVYLDIKPRKVKVRELDQAYKAVFPKYNTKIINK